MHLNSLLYKNFLPNSFQQRRNINLDFLNGKFWVFAHCFVKKYSFIPKRLTQPLAPTGIFSGGGEVHQGRACKGVVAWGAPGGSCKFLKILKEISRFFKDVLKFYRIFCKNLGNNLEKFTNMHLL